MTTRTRLTSILLGAFLTCTASQASAQWRSVPYDASNFTAQGSMVWTVEESDQNTFRYMVNDRTMTVAVILRTTTVSGTPSQWLRIKIPGGYKAASWISNMGFLTVDSGSPYSEVVYVIANSNDNSTNHPDTLSIFRPSTANHQLSTNGMQLYFTATFDLCSDSPSEC